MADFDAAMPALGLLTIRPTFDCEGDGYAVDWHDTGDTLIFGIWERISRRETRFVAASCGAAAAWCEAARHRLLSKSALVGDHRSQIRKRRARRRPPPRLPAPRWRQAAGPRSCCTTRGATARHRRD